MARLRDHGTAFLEYPPQAHLSRTAVVFFCNDTEHVPVQIGAAGERGIGLDNDAVLLAELPYAILVKERVVLDLVDRGYDTGVQKYVIELVFIEIGYTGEPASG